jgi:homoserine O-acetyltransferase
MIALVAAATFIIIAHAAPLHAYDGVVEKKTFTLQSYFTIRGETIKNVKIGWESYGSMPTSRTPS